MLMENEPDPIQLGRKNARRKREPWLLVASPALVDLSARQLVALYA